MKNSCKSTSNSASIRDIENKYGINLSSSDRTQLDRLTSKASANRVITSVRDLMMNSNQFDVTNMTDVERANLKYLVMSTDEVLNTLKKKSRSIYYKSRNGRLRWLMSYEDFYQICAYKLLLNDGILRFNADYNFECALYCWFDRVAGWKSAKKVKIADEVTILDKPCSEDSSTTLGDLILREDMEEENDISTDVSTRIDNIIEAMDKTVSKRIVLRAGDIEIPFSECNLAKLFILHKLGKKELSKMMYNKSTNKLVANQIFNKFYKQTIQHIADLLNKECNEYGESFNINIDEF